MYSFFFFKLTFLNLFVQLDPFLKKSALYYLILKLLELYLSSLLLCIYQFTGRSIIFNGSHSRKICRNKPTQQINQRQNIFLISLEINIVQIITLVTFNSNCTHKGSTIKSFGKNGVISSIIFSGTQFLFFFFF